MIHLSLGIFKRPFRWLKNRKNAILGQNFSQFLSRVKKGMKPMATKASWVLMQISHRVASMRLMGHPCSLKSPQLRPWQKPVEPFFDTRAMNSSFKNSLQGVEDCNKPTFGYLVDATSQSINIRHLYWTWEWKIKRMHKATLLEVGLGISNSVGSFQGQDSLLTSVLLNSLFRNWLWFIKYQAREVQPEFSTPILLTDFLQGSHQGSQIPYLKHEQ